MRAQAMLTVNQVAAEWGVSPSTVRRHCRDGKLPAEQATSRRGGQSGVVYLIPKAATTSSLQLRSADPHDAEQSGPINLGTVRSRGGFDAILRAADRRDIIDQAKAITGPNRTEQMLQLAKKAGIGLATLYRWVAKSEGNSLEGAVSTLRQKFDENGHRRRRSIEPEARDFFLASWNAQNRLPVAAVIEHVYKPKAREMGWKIPARATFYRLVSEDLSAVEKKAGRDGIKALRGQTLPKNTLAFPTQRNLVWASDHRQFDTFAINPATGKPERPWCTAIIDVASRVLIGWKLSFSPDGNGILTALNSAIYADSPFEPALPVWFLEDNGQDYRSRMVTGTLEMLGIRQRQCEVESGWQKGTIESFFKIVSSRFDHFMPGYTGNNVMRRPDALDEKALAADGKIYTMEEFELCWRQFLTWYHTEHQHTGEGMNGTTPLTRYNELAPARIGVPAATTMPLLMMKEERRRVTDQGIKIFNKFMWHDALYRHDNPVHRSVVDEWVTVRFDPQDQAHSRIVVFFEGQFVCVASDKPMPTFNPDDAENMETAGRITALGKKLHRETLERLHERAARAGTNPWIPPLVNDKEPAEKAGTDSSRMITPMDRVAKQIEDQQRKDSTHRRRNEDVSSVLRERGSKFA